MGGDPWIGRYIFPGSAITSISQISKAAEDLWVMEDWQNFDPDYGKTLLACRDNCEKYWGQLPPSYDEKFNLRSSRSYDWRTTHNEQAPPRAEADWLVRLVGLGLGHSVRQPRLPSAKVLGREIPINQFIQHCVDIVRAAVLVIQIVGVFPNIDGQ